MKQQTNSSANESDVFQIPEIYGPNFSRFLEFANALSRRLRVESCHYLILDITPQGNLRISIEGPPPDLGSIEFESAPIGYRVASQTLRRRLEGAEVTVVLQTMSAAVEWAAQEVENALKSMAVWTLEELVPAAEEESSEPSCINRSAGMMGRTPPRSCRRSLCGRSARNKTHRPPS